MEETNKKSIILFDGICNLCNASVQFVLKHDRKQHFLFTSLQSDASVKLLLQVNNKNNSLNSIVLIEGDKIYYKSTAVLRIARKLNGLWMLFYVFIIIPKFFRDSIYDFVVKHRYKWFGKRNKCLLYIVEYKNRFI
jgi:predicted DCC family thiol-disulfide oxidoreductase YuxK